MDRPLALLSPASNLRDGHAGFFDLHVVFPMQVQDQDLSASSSDLANSMACVSEAQADNASATNVAAVQSENASMDSSDEAATAETVEKRSFSEV